MENSFSNLVISMPKGQDVISQNEKCKDSTDEKLPIWTIGSELLFISLCRKFLERYSSCPFNALFHFL